MRKLTLILDIADDQDVSNLIEIASFMSWSDLSVVRDQQQTDINRLTAEVEKASTTANDNYQVILKCNGHINDLKRQLNASQALLAEAEYQIEKQTIETRVATQLASDYIKQLAEARAEVERLDAVINKARDISNWRGEG